MGTKIPGVFLAEKSHLFLQVYVFVIERPKVSLQLYVLILYSIYISPWEGGVF